MRGSAVFRTGVAPGGALAGPWVRDPLWARARAVPSLDLRFADNKSLVDAVTGASLVTFTRASGGTFVNSAGVLQTAATNEPRFDHNPTTGESLGLLVEEQRTNLLVRSNGFDTTWTNSSSSETAASGTAPDGTNTAWELKDTVDVSAVIHSIAQGGVSFTSGVAYTFSVWAKSGTLSVVGLQLPAAGFATALASRYNLATGTVSAIPAGATAEMQAFSNGWYRCSLTATATATASGAVNFRTAVGGNVLYQGDGTGTILIYGAQLEAGAFPTSYIPTTTAAATRSADVASITGSAFFGWYRQGEGTVFAEFIPNVSGSASGPGANPGLLTFNDAAGSGFRGRSSRLSLNNTASIRWGSRVSSTIVELAGAIHNSFLAAGQTYKAGFSYGNAFLAGSVNSSINEVSDTNYSSIVVADQMQIGFQSMGGTPTQLNGTLKRLSFWPAKLPNSTLQTITQ